MEEAQGPERPRGCTLGGAIDDRPAYVAWLVGACKAKDATVASIIDDAAIALLAERLRTPLQIEQHLGLAFEHGFRCGEKPVTAEVVESVIARELDDLERA